MKIKYLKKIFFLRYFSKMCIKIVTHERREYNLNTRIFQLTWTKLLQYFQQLISTIYIFLLYIYIYHRSQRFIVFNYNIINFTVDILNNSRFFPDISKSKSIEIGWKRVIYYGHRQALDWIRNIWRNNGFLCTRECLRTT